MLNPAIQTIWSKEILFQAMPVLRFEQFAVKKTELGVQPGLTVNFMRYNNLPIPDGPTTRRVSSTHEKRVPSVLVRSGGLPDTMTLMSMISGEC
jgi:hypothetical protein